MPVLKVLSPSSYIVSDGRLQSLWYQWNEAIATSLTEAQRYSQNVADFTRRYAYHSLLTTIMYHAFTLHSFLGPRLPRRLAISHYLCPGVSDPRRGESRSRPILDAMLTGLTAAGQKRTAERSVAVQQPRVARTITIAPAPKTIARPLWDASRCTSPPGSCIAAVDGKSVSPYGTCGRTGTGANGYRCPENGLWCCSLYGFCWKHEQ